MNPRIIPRLDIKGAKLVKGIHLEGVRVLGEPQQFARHYYETGADELLYMDVVASLYDRESILATVERTAREVFIPLTVGGGLRSLEDIQRVLNVGADKVAINTAAIRNPNLIREAANRFGASTIVVSVEAKRMPDGSHEAYSDSGRERSGLNAVAWARQAVDLGAGEIMLTSIDHEGAGRGFALDLVREIATTVTVPVIASGGAGEMEHVRAVLQEGAANAVGLASLLHYHYLKAVSANNPSRPAPRAPARLKGCTLPELKDYLTGCGTLHPSKRHPGT